MDEPHCPDRLSRAIDFNFATGSERPAHEHTLNPLPIRRGACYNLQRDGLRGDGHSK